MPSLNFYANRGWEQIGIAVYTSNADFHEWSGSLTMTEPCHLNVSTSTSPSIGYREHAARFAHQLDAALGHHTLASADEIDRLTVWNTLRAMIGVAARKYSEWEKIDPEELIVGGNFDGTPVMEA